MFGFVKWLLMGLAFVILVTFFSIKNAAVSVTESDVPVTQVSVSKPAYNVSHVGNMVDVAVEAEIITI